MCWGRVTEVTLSVITLTGGSHSLQVIQRDGRRRLPHWESGFGNATATGTGGRDQVELTGGAPPSSRNRAAPSPNLLPLGAARQTAFMCARAQSAKFVNPPGTRALAAAMYRSCSGPKYVCSAKYWNISRISWAPG